MKFIFDMMFVHIAIFNMYWNHLYARDYLLKARSIKKRC